MLRYYSPVGDERNFVLTVPIILTRCILQLNAFSSSSVITTLNVNQ